MPSATATDRLTAPMSKRSVFTSITALPPQTGRAAILAFLHDYEAMIDVNHLVIDRYRIAPPPDAAPDEAACVWYQLTDAVVMPWASAPSSSARPASKPKQGNVSYTCAFHRLPDGLQTHCRAPMGVDIRSRWTVGGTQPGEPRQPTELGLARLGAPAAGLYLREDVDLRCNRLMAGFVKRTLKKSHATLVHKMVQSLPGTQEPAPRAEQRPVRSSAGAEDSPHAAGSPATTPPHGPHPAYNAYRRPQQRQPPPHTYARHASPQSAVGPAAPRMAGPPPPPPPPPLLRPPPPPPSLQQTHTARPLQPRALGPFSSQPRQDVLDGRAHPVELSSSFSSSSSSPLALLPLLPPPPPPPDPSATYRRFDIRASPLTRLQLQLPAVVAAEPQRRLLYQQLLPPLAATATATAAAAGDLRRHSTGGCDSPARESAGALDPALCPQPLRVGRRPGSAAEQTPPAVLQVPQVPQVPPTRAPPPPPLPPPSPPAQQAAHPDYPVLNPYAEESDGNEDDEDDENDTSPILAAGGRSSSTALVFAELDGGPVATAAAAADGREAAAAAAAAFGPVAEWQRWRLFLAQDAA